MFLVTVVVFGFFYWAYLIYSNYNKCLNGESVYCPSMFCNNPSDEIAAKCGKYPYRIDQNTNEVICAKYLLTDVAPTTKPTDQVV